MIVVLILALFSAVVQDAAEERIRVAISDFHSRKISAEEFLSGVRSVQYSSPTGAALAALFKLATAPDAMLALPAGLALLDGSYTWSDEEFAGNDAAWRAYVADARWFAASRDTPFVTSSNELMTRHEWKQLPSIAEDVEKKLLNGDTAVTRRALAPLLKLDRFPGMNDTLLAKLAASADPLVRVAEIQFGCMTHGSARPPTKLDVRRKDFVQPIRACIQSDDWLAVQQGLRWGELVLGKRGFEREVERPLMSKILDVRIRTARFLMEKGIVAANLEAIIRDGLQSNDAMCQCGALVLLRVKPAAAADFATELRATLCSPNALIAEVAASTIAACAGSLSTKLREWRNDRDPAVRAAMLSLGGTHHHVRVFLDHRDTFARFEKQLLPEAAERLEWAKAGSKDRDARVRAAAVDLTDRLYSFDQNPAAAAQLRSFLESTDREVAERAMRRVAKRWKLVVELPPNLRGQALDRVVANFQSSDWTTYCDARVVLVNLPELSLPRLMPLLESSESAPLRNKLILEHYPFEIETGTCFSCYFIPYELDRIAGRTAHLIQMLSDHDFGFHFQKVWNVRNKDANPNGAHEKLDDDSPSRKKERDERFSSAVARAKAWWRKSGATYTRLSTLIDSLKSSDVDRQRRALEYLVEGGAVCLGLDNEVWMRDIRPAVEQLKESANDYVRNTSNHLLEDEEMQWLKIKTGAIWTIR